MVAALVPNAPDAGRNNRLFIEGARGHIHAPGGIIHIETPVHYNVNGGRITGEGGCPLRTPEAAAVHDDNPQFMVATRFVPTNPAPDRDFLVLCGTGQKVLDIQVYGRRWVEFHTPPTGPRSKSCIAVQALSNPPSGRHAIRDCLLADADVGISTLEGGGDTHADLLFVENVYASQCRAFFQSGNMQSVSHTFVHCFMENDSECVGFELLKGGKLDVFGFRQNSPQATLLAAPLDGWPNCNYVEIYGYHWDHADVAGTYFCPLDSDKASMNGVIRGHANNPQPPCQFKFEYRDAGLKLNPGLHCRVVGAK